MPQYVPVDKNVRAVIDFFTFKMMLVEGLAPLLFFLAMIGLLVWSINMMRMHVGLGTLSLIGGFVVIRILSEMVMVFFGILGTLRQIRDEVSK